MKTAIYINQGYTQLVLTPETEFEKDILERVCKTYPHSGDGTITSVTRGSFYECQGGYVRQGTSEDSLILGFKPNSIP